MNPEISIILSKIYPLLFSSILIVDFVSAPQDNGEEIDNYKFGYKESKIEKLVEKVFLSPSNSNSSIEKLKLMQIVILMKSLRVSEEDDDEEDEKIISLLDNFIECPVEKFGISLISKNSSNSNSLILNQIIEEGNELFDKFLRSCRELSAATLTGWINLLHPIIKSRPSFFPYLIPTLLSFTENNNNKWSDSFSTTQKRNILHTLKAELSTLISVPRAEKFYSLILESLDKCKALHTATKQQQNNKESVTSTTTIPIEDFEEEERELAASLGGIQDRMSSRPSGAFAAEASINNSEKSITGLKIMTSNTNKYESLVSEALTRELVKIPVPMVVEMVVRMLGSWTVEQIKPVVINRWALRHLTEDDSSSLINENLQQSTINSTPVEIVLKKTTEEAFSLEASPLTPEFPGEIIHLGMARILQSITDLSEFHASSRREDLVVPLMDSDLIFKTSGVGSGTGEARGIPVPLIPLCRIVALVAAHVGHVRSDILMDPEDRRKKLDRQFDPRFKGGVKAVDKIENKDIFGSSDSEKEEEIIEEEFEKSVNQIVLGWINEDLPGRFDFVWYWLEAVWIREGKSSGNLMNDSDEFADYDKLFDDVIGVVGEYFISDEDEIENELGTVIPGAIERVLKILLRVPKLNASLIRNLLYPLIEDERFRPAALHALSQLILTRPALRAMLTDFVMTLAGSEEGSLRKDTIEILLLKEGLYPGLRSLSSQLEAYSLDLMDDLTKDPINENENSSENAMKKLKLSSTDAFNENFNEIHIDSTINEEDNKDNEEDNNDNDDDSLLDEFREFEANTELFLGLLKRNPERLLPPLLVRFPRFSPKLQAFLLDRSLPQVIQSWSVRELRGLLNVLRSDVKADEGGVVGELVNQIVQLVLNSTSSESIDADLVDFYTEISELIQGKVTSGTWNGRLIPSLLPWILRDRSDLLDFFSIYLPKLISTSPSTFLSTVPKICSIGISNQQQLITPTQLFVQIHLLTSSMVPLKNLIETIQLIFGSVNSGSGDKPNNNNKGDQIVVVFTVNAISSGLGQLVDQSPLPQLLGRSLLQSISLLNPVTSLNGPFLISLLARLIPRKIWEAGKLWEGWIRCCRALLPGSLSVLLQLPTGQLEKLLKDGGMGVDLKVPLKEYLYNQPPSVRNRYTSILSAIEK